MKEYIKTITFARRIENMLASSHFLQVFRELNVEVGVSNIDCVKNPMEGIFSKHHLSITGCNVRMS